MSAELLDFGPYPSLEHTDLVPANDQLLSQARLADSIDRLGRLECIRSDAIVDGNGLGRIQLKAAIRIGGSQYALRIIEPALDYNHAPGLVAMMSGFTEDPAYGTAKQLQNHVATEYPDRRIVSISSDGYNRNGTPMTWRNIGRGFRDMGLARQVIISELAGDEPVTLNGLSRGTVLAHNVLQHNQDNELFDNDVTIYHSPAIVPPEKVIKDMIVKFVPHIYMDTIREARQHPIAALKSLRLPSARILPAYICDIYNLLHGTQESEVHDLLSGDMSLGIVKGTLDPLGQPEMWQRIQQAYPDKVHILDKPGHGHGVSLNAREAAADIKTVAGTLLARSAIAYS